MARASADAVILNYKRPGNIGRIVDACLACPAIDRVHVIDQAAAEQQLCPPGADRIVYSRQPNIGAARRVSYSARLDCRLVIGIDDDIFPTAEQIGALIARSGRFPARVHGVEGQEIVAADGMLRLSWGIKQVDRLVDVINRIYVFSPRQAQRAIALGNLLGLRWNALGPLDDILLSVAPVERPLCHDIGAIADCESSRDPATAVSKQRGFHRARLELVRRLRGVGFFGGLPQPG